MSWNLDRVAQASAPASSASASVSVSTDYVSPAIAISRAAVSDDINSVFGGGDDVDEDDVDKDDVEDTDFEKVSEWDSHGVRVENCHLKNFLLVNFLLLLCSR